LGGGSSGEPQPIPGPGSAAPTPGAFQALAGLGETGANRGAPRFGELFDHVADAPGLDLGDGNQEDGGELATSPYEAVDAPNDIKLSGERSESAGARCYCRSRRPDGGAARSSGMIARAPAFIFPAQV
jgi:hypothetical protein